MNRALAGQGTIRVTCPKGLSPWLAGEMRALGFADPDEQAAGVETKGAFEDCLRLNLWLRTGHRVLWELARFRAKGPDDLYAEAARLPFEDIIPEDGHLTVNAVADEAAVRDSRFAALKLKDAVVDRIAAKKGRRPDSGPEATGACLFLHWREGLATVYLDTSGEPLSRRGYRVMPWRAPLQETLAAGILMAAGWPDCGPHFVNPMCGSGTLAIEAALMAANRAPGQTRPAFAFMRLRGYDARLWEELKAEARAAERPLPGLVLASDMEAGAVEAAQKNAATAGLRDVIRIARCDFRQAEVPPEGGLVLFNPGYGERLGDRDRLAEDYAAIGDFLKQRCAGYTGGVFTGNADLAKRIGLKPRRRIPFFNAKIECRLLLFELYAGSRKARP